MDRFELAAFFMKKFAKESGLTKEDLPQKRYLWTDAFGVCNFISLYEKSKDIKYLNLAFKLVDSVHNILGKFREDDKRKGFISGLSQKDALLHPTIGGLRIGKKLQERAISEPFDEGLEWERDGQYFHYLTKWMHALSRLTQITRDHKYNLWAMELAKVAFEKFTYLEYGKRKMYWKMSVDLSYPLVKSMGHHDPLDGFVTYMEIEEIAKLNPDFYYGLTLNREIKEFYTMTKDISLATSDSLGIGGLLSDILFLAQLNFQDYKDFLLKMIEASIVSIEFYMKNNHLNYPAHYRLAFRELGLVIGIEGVKIFDDILKNNQFYEEIKFYIDVLKKFGFLEREILAFWLDERNRRNEIWIEHKEINEVMLATALLPEGFLKIEKEEK